MFNALIVDTPLVDVGVDIVTVFVPLASTIVVCVCNLLLVKVIGLILVFIAVVKNPLIVLFYNY